MEDACSITRTGLQHRPVSEKKPDLQPGVRCFLSSCSAPERSEQSRAAALAETHTDLSGATGGTAAPTATSSRLPQQHQNHNFFLLLLVGLWKSSFFFTSTKMLFLYTKKILLKNCLHTHSTFNLMTETAAVHTPGLLWRCNTVFPDRRVVCPVHCL